MSFFPSKNEFKDYKKNKFSVIPVGVELPIDMLSPIHVYNAIDKAGYSKKFMLESADGGEDVGRFSYIGFSPINEIKVVDSELEVTSFLKKKTTSTKFSFKKLDEVLSKYKAPIFGGNSNIVGGTSGYVSYDAVKYIEDIPFFESKKEDIHLFTFRNIIVFDRLKNRVNIISNFFPSEEKKTYEQMIAHVNKIKELVFYSSSVGPLDFDLGKTSLSKELSIDGEIGEKTFLDAVKKVKEHIKNGDIFQCVISDKFNFEFNCDSFLFYRVLRTLNPSPYLFILDFADEALIGSSPEMLVKISDSTIETSPIAGTRPRGKTSIEDEKFIKQLNASVKEKAEHLMLVDLGRNDIGRVSKPGTVEVTKFMHVEKYSHVMHLVSVVEGKLKKIHISMECICIMFPSRDSFWCS